MEGITNENQRATLLVERERERKREGVPCSSQSSKRTFVTGTHMIVSHSRTVDTLLTFDTYKLDHFEIYYNIKTI